jgi:hypothetical protein
MIAFHDQLAVLPFGPGPISKNQLAIHPASEKDERNDPTHQPQQIGVLAKVHRLKVVGDERFSTRRVGRVEVDLGGLEGYVQGRVAGL